PKGGRGGKGVKEKSGVVPSAKAIKDTVMVSSSVMEEHVATVNTEDVKVGQTPTSPNVNPKPGTSYANLFTTGLSRKDPDVNLLKEDGGNVPVWGKLHGVLVTAFSEDGLSAIATKLGTHLMLDSYTSDMYIHSWGRLSYARAMIKVRANVELKDTIVVAMPKLSGEGFYMCTVRVEYEWKPPRCACCKVFGHILEECPKNPGLGVAKNLKKPSQATRGVSIGLKVGFKPAKEYRPVSKKSTANTSGNKKKGVEPTKELVIQTHLMCLIRLKMIESWVPIGGLQIWLVMGPILVALRSGMLKPVILVLLLLLIKLESLKS
ncbi:RNA-directed DNA polymerase, eukaryota, reverse transcriptase zinc-binding domain protein, partial [Tanacetum coccineum]